MTRAFSKTLDRKSLCAAILRVAHLTGHFKLRSGQTSTEYFDKYRFEADPQLLRSIAEQLVPLIPPATEVLAGLEMGGIPIATALSLETGLPVVFVRKEAKLYGTEKVCEGADVAGRRVCIVEDVVTTGGQILLSAKDLRDLGAHIEDVVCVIDREAGGKEKLRLEGALELQALFSMAELKSAKGKA
jgi:orotate phosphoribosyltransferase